MLNLEQKFHFKFLAQRACAVARIPAVRVAYDVRGGVGGNFDFRNNTINLNEVLAVQNFNEYNNIVVHEVAHAIDFVRNGNKFRKNGRGRIFHDKVFKNIMWEVIRALKTEFQKLGEPSTCHQFDVTKVARRQRRWEYDCGCDGKPHKIATVTHNRIQRKVKRFTCNTCEEVLLWTGKEIKS